MELGSVRDESLGFGIEIDRNFLLRANVARELTQAAPDVQNGVAIRANELLKVVRAKHLPDAILREPIGVRKSVLIETLSLV